MRATRFRIIRGTSTARLARVWLSGELIQDLDTNYLYIGDGVTMGGVLAAPLAAVSSKISLPVKNESGVTIPKGYPMHSLGENASGITLVEIADAGNAAKMPAFSVAENDILNGSTGLATLQGDLEGVDMSGFTNGHSLHVAVGGGVTMDVPAEPAIVQHIGVVDDAEEDGSMIVIASVGNDVPNLANNKIWIGSTGLPTQTVDFDTRVAASPAVAGKEPAITGTTSADFWSGAKTFINFANTVRSTVLTGLVTTSSAVVAATDTILEAIGKLQGQLNQFTRYTLVTTAPQSVATTTPTTVTELTTVSLATGRYKFKLWAIMQSTSITAGVALRMNSVGATIDAITAAWSVDQNPDGTGKRFEYSQLSTATDISTPSVDAANTDFVAIGDGEFSVTSAGTVAIQIRSETGTSISIRSRSVLVVEKIA